MSCTPRRISSEHGRAAMDEGAAIGGRLDALRCAVEETHAERMLEVGDGLRDDRLRDGKPLRRLGHAPRLGDSEKDVQVAQLDASTDPVAPRHGDLLPIAEWL